ncbi:MULTISPECIES: type II secretion system inner membrane protein GspF [Pseudomonas syringae group genomosp. 2]|uniref:Proteinral secretion pathway protein F n=3 Tax=Pseudomonas syringae group genomosp. 2 TaxID=251698 RepID=A0A3M5ZFY5_PSESS|nr:MULTISPECIES: type II secretion system inner membrane protein GspF [Pseudomonas syringae group genomosp. 2]KPX01243.1 proteinral secretion pathway protein F [Pseudomonas syringae pv. cunninghamiae]KPX20004.1 proteinral secretion pathway protein GspF [Pseudomonas amygdali pv. dendropanacis]KPX54468.1 proteinral secretion pathway protein GspF [Pseudomonas amygdali pv. photiniae]KWS77448.1 type II secretion system protein GspF [Pseudomonas amygdali pv. dendropanacis]RMS49543.1 proteinral secre
MSLFKYRALDAQGAPQNGTLEARDQDAAIAALQKRGLMVLQIDAAGMGGLRRALGSGLLNGAALVSFTQQLATLLGAGQPLERSLGILLKQPGQPQTKALIERIREQVKAGKPLSVAMEEEGTQFSPLYISMVRAGEAGGALESTLRQLSDYLERSQLLRGEVINALIYPAFLVVGVLGSLALLLAYVVPQFVPIFKDLGVPIPLITEVILNLGQFLSNYGLAVLASLIALIWGMAIRMRDPQRRERRDRRILGIRVIGPLLQRIEAARLTRTLGTLLTNGVALLQALVIARQVCTNRALQAQVEQAAESVKGGGTLASAFGAQPLLPDLALQMIEVGEQAGELDTMLMKVADVFDVEAKRGIDRMLAALVPALTVVMAGMVAVIMLAIMLPLMSLTSNI